VSTTESHDHDGHRKDLPSDTAAFLKQFNVTASALLLILRSVEYKAGWIHIPLMLYILESLIERVNSFKGYTK